MIEKSRNQRSELGSCGKCESSDSTKVQTMGARLLAGLLVAGLHACGGLSDIVIDVALAGSSALALVPCCHSTKISHDAAAAAIVGLDEAIDAARARRLKAAGWAVERDTLCSREITPKNGLLLARPSAVAAVEPRPLYPRSLPPLSFGWRGSCAR